MADDKTVIERFTKPDSPKPTVAVETRLAKSVAPVPAPVKDADMLDDDAPLRSIMSSPSAIKQLEDRGIRTVGQLRSACEPEAKSVFNPAPKPIEGDHPIELRSPWASYVLRLVPGDIITSGLTGRPRILIPIAIEFRAGEAKMTREHYLQIKHQRDEKAINEELLKPVSEAPWRADALSWLRRREAFRRNNFAILE